MRNDGGGEGGVKRGESMEELKARRYGKRRKNLLINERKRLQ